MSATILVFLLAGFAAAKPVERPLRHYVLLEQAVQTVREGKTEPRTLQIEWLPPATPGAAARFESVRLVGERALARAEGSVTSEGDRFYGELRLPAAPDRAAGVWRFTGPNAGTDSEGTFEGEQAGNPVAGRARVLVVYDAAMRRSDHGLRAWVPPGPEPVRGLFIWGNGGRADARYMVVNDRWLAFCRLHRFALAATSAYGPDMEGADGASLRQQLADVAAQSRHPELASVPVLFTGHSNGGQMAWEFNAAFPERVIAFTVSKGGLYLTREVSRPALRNPAILIAGEKDTPGNLASIAQLFAGHRPEGAPWAFAVEPGVDHSFGRTAHLWLPFFEWAVQARCPRSGAAVGPEQAILQPIDPTSGWLIVQRPLKAGEKLFGPAREIKAAIADTSWLGNGALALAYLGFAAKASPLALALDPDRDAFFPGEKVRLTVTKFGAKPWSEVRLIVNDRTIGKVSPDQPSLTLSLEQPGVYLAMAIGVPAAADAVTELAGPVSWVVEPPLP